MLDRLRDVAFAAVLLFGPVLAAIPAAAAPATAAPATTTGKADSAALLNRGQDPFFRVSSGIAACPEPLGPRIDEAAWQRETHHRLERGYRCHAEGRCRLSNSYHYDAEIAETVRRRLQWLASHGVPLDRTSLWVTVSRRWVTVQGCVPPGFAITRLTGALGEVEGVERVIDETTTDPAGTTPYRVMPAAR